MSPSLTRSHLCGDPGDHFLFKLNSLKLIGMGEDSPKKQDNQGDEHIGDILVQQGFLTKEEIERALVLQKDMNKQSKRKFRLGEVLLFQKK